MPLNYNVLVQTNIPVLLFFLLIRKFIHLSSHKINIKPRNTLYEISVNKNATLKKTIYICYLDDKYSYQFLISNLLNLLILKK